MSRLIAIVLFISLGSATAYTQQSAEALWRRQIKDIINGTVKQSFSISNAEISNLECGPSTGLCNVCVVVDVQDRVTGQRAHIARYMRFVQGNLNDLEDGSVGSAATACQRLKYEKFEALNR